MRRKTIGAIPVWQFDLLSGFGSLSHGITTRHGGVSEGPYAHLNLGLHVGDGPERAIEDRRRVCRALGVDSESCTSCHSEEFYSERKLGRPTGRFGAFLSLR